MPQKYASDVHFDTEPNRGGHACSLSVSFPESYFKGSRCSQLEKLCGMPKGKLTSEVDSLVTTPTKPAKHHYNSQLHRITAKHTIPTTTFFPGPTPQLLHPQESPISQPPYPPPQLHNPTLLSAPPYQKPPSLRPPKPCLLHPPDLKVPAHTPRIN